MPALTILQQSEQDIRRTFDINVMAHLWVRISFRFPTHGLTNVQKLFSFQLIQSFLPGMIVQNKGHIVALSSIAGLAGLRNIVPYCGSKFAVRGLMEALSEELRPQNVNVISSHSAVRSECNLLLDFFVQVKCTVVYPYMVDTGLCKKPYIRFKSLMKLLTPNEVAENIIKAQRRGLDNVTVPRPLMYVNNVAR